MEFWEDERLVCCHQLTEWSNLRDNVMAEVDGKVTNLWSASKTFLGHYIRSTQKLPVCSYVTFVHYIT